MYRKNYRYEEFLSKEGITYKIKIPCKSANINSFFIFSCHKCGSTLQDNIVKEILTIADIPYIEINQNAFTQGVPIASVRKDIQSIIYPRGYAYIGFRGFFNFPLDVDLTKNKKICLVRDPKDALVSRFFSIKYSHVVPEGGQMKDNILTMRKNMKERGIEIGEFVLGLSKVHNENLKRYMRLGNENLKIFRYEDIIYNKVKWIEEICMFLGLSIDSNKIKKIVSKYDIFPDTENVNEHIRQVHPGNYKKYLKEETIQKLNIQFEEFYEFYGYI